MLQMKPEFPLLVYSVKLSRGENHEQATQELYTGRESSDDPETPFRPSRGFGFV